MASIGLQYPVYATLTENADGTHEYGTGKRGKKLIRAEISLNISDSKLYADDAVAESLKEFIDGTITIEQDELDNTMRKDLLGNSTSSITVGTEQVEELTSKDTDVAPYVGIGFIQSKIIGNARQYRAIFLTKVQFGESNETAETKGASVSWQTPSIVGTIMRRNDGVWKEEITTPSLQTAIDYLKGKVNITP